MPRVRALTRRGTVVLRVSYRDQDGHAMTLIAATPRCAHFPYYQEILTAYFSQPRTSEKA
jgi:hypothetical protein